MRFHRPGFEFRVKLTSQKPGMITNFDDLNQLAIGRDTAETQTGLLQLFFKFIVKLITVAMPL